MLLKKIKKIFKLMDQYSVPISLRYKGDDYYSTALGGIFSLLVFLLGLIFGIIYFIPFVRRKNFSLYYNTINLSETETIKFDESNSILAIGLECNNDPNGEKLSNYLDIQIKYYNKYMNDEGIYDKIDTRNIPKNINYNICNYTDFYKDYKNSQYKNKELKCLESSNTQIGGHYGDKIFQYYEISLLSKKNEINSNEEDLIKHFKEIDNILLNHDCKLELHYKDVSFDFNDYSEPIKSFVNEVFLQLNPESILKMNLYYMNLYFENDHNLFFPTEDEQQINNSVSRTEQYFLYKGLNRGELKPTDYQYYAKIYIRADTKKIRVKRKYQNISEFYSDTFCFWGGVSYFIGIFLNIYNKFYRNRSFEKIIFFFEGFENKHIEIPSKPSKCENNDKSSSKNLNQGKKEGDVIINNNDKNDKNDKNQKNVLLKSLSCKKNNKEILSSKATDIMNDKLDIRFYINKMLYLEKKIDESLDIPKISITKEEIKYGEYNKQSDKYNKINLENTELTENKGPANSKNLIGEGNQHSIPTYTNESFENSNNE